MPAQAHPQPSPRAVLNQEMSSEMAQSLAIGLVATGPPTYGFGPNPQPPSPLPGISGIERIGEPSNVVYSSHNDPPHPVWPPAANPVAVTDPTLVSNVGPNAVSVGPRVAAGAHDAVCAPAPANPPGQFGGPQGASLDPMSVVLTGVALTSVARIY